MGIKISNNLEEILQSSGNVVVQEYIERPLLVNQRKFDVRVYVVIKGVDPIEAYLCEEGLARFCTVSNIYDITLRYSKTIKNLTT